MIGIDSKALLALAAGLALSATARGGFTIQTVVDSTGTLTSVGFGGALTTPISLNNVGQVAFRGNGPAGAGIFIAGAGSIGTVVTAADPQFDSFGYPAINNLGIVAFRADQDNGDVGLFTIAPGGVRTTRFLDSNSPVELLEDAVSISDSGWIAAVGRAQSGTFGGGGIVLASSPSGTLTVLADNTGTFNGQFRRFLSVNESGTVAFVAGRDGGEAGVYTVAGAGGAAVPVAETGAGTFQNFFFAESASITDAGTVAFKADLGFLEGGAGIYTSGSGGPELFVSADDSLIDNFGEVVAINNAGSLAFIAQPDTSGSRGIYAGSDRDKDRILQVGDPFAGSFITDIGFSNESINDDGDVAFYYRLANGIDGIAVASRSVTLQWNGGPWDTSSLSFKNDLNEAPAVFSDGDQVLFGPIDFDSVITVQPSGVTPGGNVLVSNDDPTTYTFVGGPIQGAAGLSKYGDGTLVISSVNTYTGGTNIGAGTLVTTVDGAISSSVLQLADSYWQISNVSQSHPQVLIQSTAGIEVDAGLSLTITGSIGGENPDDGALTKRGDGVLVIPTLRMSELRQEQGRTVIALNGTASGSSRVGRVLISGASDAWESTLDVNDNTLLIRDGAGTLNIARLANQIRSGHAGGSWTGTGITSAAAADAAGGAQPTALGYARTSEIFSSFPRVIDGLTINNGNQLLVRYTLPGDSNLDRRVDIADFARLAANFNVAGTVWSRGDFNYDGTTGIADFSLLAANFNQTFPGQMARANVPEPGSAAAIAFAVPLLLRRRRLRNRS